MLPAMALVSLLAVQPAMPLQTAEGALLTKLRKDSAFPDIRPECLYAVLDQESPVFYQFSVRYDQSKCGGNSASDLLDRFTVTKKTGKIRHYEVAGCYTESYKSWLKRQKR
nr:hypothetical protein [uncultured Holophaga sp.]